MNVLVVVEGSGGGNVCDGGRVGEEAVILVVVERVWWLW